MDKNAVPAPPSSLREARESAGLHIAALAAALKVPVRKLEALEAGRYDELPDMTFARALASSACRHLNLDPAPVLRQIPAATASLLGEGHQNINTPFRDGVVSRSSHLVGWGGRPAVLIAVIVLMAAVVLYFVPLGDASQPATALPPVASAVEAGSSPMATDASPVPLAPASLVSSGSETVVSPAQPAAGAVAVSSPDQSAEQPTSGASAVGPSTAAVLSIAASGETWIEVVNGQGRTVVQRMLKAGDVVDFSSTPPYNVVIGRAEAAQVNVRGKPFDTTPYARNSVARFEIK